ncbi:MAG: hypothetical protein CM15mV109_350 [uncultured marine virus]|nr:MAG: hypothetical protein CM15mV109_350 [uncultured marine virus]
MIYESLKDLDDGPELKIGFVLKRSKPYKHKAFNFKYKTQQRALIQV